MRRTSALAAGITAGLVVTASALTAVAAHASEPSTTSISLSVAKAKRQACVVSWTWTDSAGKPIAQWDLVPSSSPLTGEETPWNLAGFVTEYPNIPLAAGQSSYISVQAIYTDGSRAQAVTSSYTCPTKGKQK